MWTFLVIAFRNIFQAKRRTLLLGLAIAFVALLFVLLRSAADAVSTRMVESATTLSSGHVNVAGFYKARKKGAAPMLANRDEIRKWVQQVVPEAESIIDRHRGWGRIISPSASINGGLNGIEFAMESRLFSTLKLAPESEYRDKGKDEVRGSFEGIQKKNTIIIFAAQAKKLNVGVGDTLTVVTEGSGGQTNTVDLTVVAIARDMGMLSNWSVFVPRQVILDLYKISDETTGAVMVYLKDISQSSAVMARLREAALKKGYEVMDYDPNPFFMKFDKVYGEDWLGQKLDFTLWSDEISFIVWITSAFTLVTAFIIIILGIIIAGGIGNSMWMAVRERTREIGTIRAIGAQRSRVLWMFVLEAVLIGIMASLAGSVIGALVIAIVNSLHLPISNEGARLFLMANTVELSFRSTQFVSTLILFSVITACGAFFPALRASKLRPVEALMHSK